MATGQEWAQGLQGMGAWFSGQGPQYEAAKVAQQRTDMQDQLLRDEARQKAMVTDFSRVYAFMNAGKPELAVQLLQNRIPEIQRLYGDPKDSIALLEAVSDPARHDEAKIELEGFLGAAGALPGGGGAKRTDVFKNGAVLQATSDRSIGLTMPSGQRISPSDPGWQQAISEATGSGVQYAGDVAASQAMGAGGVNIQIEPLIAELVARSKAGVEAETRPGIEAEVTQRTEEAKRNQGVIDLGYDSAKSVPSMQSALELVKQVNTGGLASLGNEVLKRFGIQDANAAEAENLFNMAVLQQLKPTFGAAFTVKEGDWLKDINANFGKSREGNIRLLEKGIEKANRYAKYGMARAIDREDMRTADEIRDLISGKAPERSVLRRGVDKATGKRVVMYSDGTVEPE